jgi:hypothetical protein
LKLTNDLSFSARVTGAINTNKVLSLTPVYNGLFPLYDPNGVQYFARPGNSAYEFAITDWKRDPQGRVIIDKNTGFPIEADPKEFTIGGNTLPK